MSVGLKIDRCIEDALPRLGRAHTVPCHRSAADVEIAAWFQQWSDSGCGFHSHPPEGPLVTTQGFCRALTVVVISRHEPEFAVYHGGRFAYLVRRPGQHFWDAMSNQELPGGDPFTARVIILGADLVRPAPASR